MDSPLQTAEEISLCWFHMKINTIYLNTTIDFLYAIIIVNIYVKCHYLRAPLEGLNPTAEASNCFAFDFAFEILQHRKEKHTYIMHSTS